MRSVPQAIDLCPATLPTRHHPTSSKYLARWFTVPQFIRMARQSILSRWQASSDVPAPDASMCNGPRQQSRPMSPDVPQGQLKLGQRLAAAVAAGGRTLADMGRLSTDLGGCGVGTRLRPVAHGEERLVGRDATSKLAQAISAALAEGHLQQDAQRALATQRERCSSNLYADAPQVMADMVRYGLAPLAMRHGPVRDALSLALQTPAA